LVRRAHFGRIDEVKRIFCRLHVSPVAHLGASNLDGPDPVWNLQSIGGTF
jgi:hypothetical protein